MRLELAEFHIADAEFGKNTRLDGGLLKINAEELSRLVLEDKRIAQASIDIAIPGQKTRIVRVRDVVEPRLKISGPGCVFPGILGPIETVGEGRTNRLSGLAVVASADFKPTIVSGTSAPNAGLIDTWGPARHLTPFSSTINVVVALKLSGGLTEWEAHNAILSAELKVAQRLAETSIDRTPDNVETLELGQVNASLPRVVYILTCLTRLSAPHSGVAYYGHPIGESLPTIVHPNELFDGILTANTLTGGGTFTTTWMFMDLPIIRKLFKEHGKRINFLGVILQRTRFETEFSKQLTALCTSQVAKLLGADGAVITRMSTAGNNFVDVMLTVQACEKKGIKTAFLTPEWGGKNGTDLPLALYAPEATAMVSTGSFERDVKIGAPEKVIGCKQGELVNVYAGDRPFSPWDELTLPSSFLFTGGVDFFGYLNLTCAEY